MNRKENKAYKAMNRALKAMDKALDSASDEHRHAMFNRFMAVLSAGSSTGKIYRIQLDRIKAAGVQAERDRQTAQTQEVYEW